MDLTLPSVFQDIEILTAVLVCILLSAFLLDKLGEKSGLKGRIAAVAAIVTGIAFGAVLGDKVDPDFGSHLFGLIGGTIGLVLAYLGIKAFQPFMNHDKSAVNLQENANEKQ